MIKNFEVKNYKCHEDYNSFRIPGITIVSGTNNSGKSSLLQAIYLLTQNRSINYPVLSLNEELGLGTFTDILNKKQPNTENVELSIDFDEKVLERTIFEELIVNYVYVNPNSLKYISLPFQEENPLLYSIILNYKKKLEDEYNIIEIRLVDEKNVDNIIYCVNGEKDKGFCNITNNVPDVILYTDIEKTSKEMISTELDQARDILMLLNKENIKYLKAFRLDNYSVKNTSLSRELGLSGEYTAEILNQRFNNKTNLTDYYTGEKFEVFSKVFDYWIKRLLGENYKIRSHSNDHGSFKIVVINNITNFEFSLSQVGFGISQLLPIITLLLTSKENDLLLIENPEVHLHPKLQSLFVDLCIFILNNNRKIIVETHSEHLINRIRLRIKENNQLINKQNILFFEQVDGEFTYTDIEVDEEGKINFWPKNFFDQTYNDLLGLIDLE